MLARDKQSSLLSRRGNGEEEKRSVLALAPEDRISGDFPPFFDVHLLRHVDDEDVAFRRRKDKVKNRFDEFGLFVVVGLILFAELTPEISVGLKSMS